MKLQSEKCPVCGHRLLDAECIGRLQTKCKKCSKIISIEFVPNQAPIKKVITYGTEAKII